MTFLDRLDSPLASTYIIRRFYLVQLVDCRLQLEQKHKPRQRRTLRKTSQKQEPRPRASSQALSDMMAEAYPELKRDTDDYSKRLTTLKNRLSNGRNWHRLANQFGTGILALVPIDG